MADNPRVNTREGWRPVATDQIDGVDYQRVKQGFGADGVYQDVHSGSPMPVRSPGSSTAFSGSHTTHATPETASAVRSANAARESIYIVNDSDTVVYLHLASSGGALASGIRLNPDGGSWSSDTYKGAVRSICAEASKTLTVAEVG